MTQLNQTNRGPMRPNHRNFLAQICLTHPRDPRCISVGDVRSALTGVGGGGAGRTDQRQLGTDRPEGGPDPITVNVFPPPPPGQRERGAERQAARQEGAGRGEPRGRPQVPRRVPSSADPPAEEMGVIRPVPPRTGPTSAATPTPVRQTEGGGPDPVRVRQGPGDRPPSLRASARVRPVESNVPNQSIRATETPGLPGEVGVPRLQGIPEGARQEDFVQEGEITPPTVRRDVRPAERPQDVSQDLLDRGDRLLDQRVVPRAAARRGLRVKFDEPGAEEMAPVDTLGDAERPVPELPEGPARGFAADVATPVTGEGRQALISNLSKKSPDVQRRAIQTMKDGGRDFTDAEIAQIKGGTPAPTVARAPAAQEMTPVVRPTTEPVAERPISLDEFNRRFPSSRISQGQFNQMPSATRRLETRSLVRAGPEQRGVTSELDRAVPNQSVRPPARGAWSRGIREPEGREMLRLPESAEHRPLLAEGSARETMRVPVRPSVAPASQELGVEGRVGATELGGLGADASLGELGGGLGGGLGAEAGAAAGIGEEAAVIGLL